MTSSDNSCQADYRRYLTAVTVARSMYQHKLIDEADYTALENVFNAQYTPLFRYPAPSHRDGIRITQDTRTHGASYAGHNEGGSI